MCGEPPADQAARFEQQIKTALPGIHARPVALQSVILSLKQPAEPEGDALNNDPPVRSITDKTSDPSEIDIHKIMR